MTYKIVKEDNIFQVEENKTNNRTGKYKDYNSVRNIYNLLKKSKGFEGWTPSFFLSSFDERFSFLERK